MRSGCPSMVDRFALAFILLAVAVGCSWGASPGRQTAAEPDKAQVGDSSLKRRILSLAKECQPAPGTPLSEVYKIWDIEVGHNLTADFDLRAIRIQTSDRGPVMEELQLWMQTDMGRQGSTFSLDPNVIRVVKSELRLRKLGPSDVLIQRNSITSAAME